MSSKPSFSYKRQLGCFADGGSRSSFPQVQKEKCYSMSWQPKFYKDGEIQGLITLSSQTYLRFYATLRKLTKLPSFRLINQDAFPSLDWQLQI